MLYISKQIMTFFPPTYNIELEYSKVLHLFSMSVYSQEQEILTLKTNCSYSIFKKSFVQLLLYDLAVSLHISKGYGSDLLITTAVLQNVKKYILKIPNT